MVLEILKSEECPMSGLLLVVCSMTLARRLQMHDQSWSSNVEPGDRRVLPSGVEKKQCLQRLTVVVVVIVLVVVVVVCKRRHYLVYLRFSLFNFLFIDVRLFSQFVNLLFQFLLYLVFLKQQ